MPYIQKEMDIYIKGIDPINEGQRNKSIMSTLSAIRKKFPLTETEVCDIANRLNREKCNPPLPTREVGIIVRSSLKIPIAADESLLRIHSPKTQTKRTKPTVPVKSSQVKPIPEIVKETLELTVGDHDNYNDMDSISIYSFANVKSPQSNGTLTLSEFFTHVAEMEELPRDEKHKLNSFCVTPSLKIEKKKGIRKGKNFTEHYNGILCLDDDNKDGEDVEKIKMKMLDFPETILTAKSFRGNGVYTFIRLELNGKELSEVLPLLNQRYGRELDEACKDVGRLRFVNQDEEILYNDDWKVLNVGIKSKKKKEEKKNEKKKRKQRNGILEDMDRFESLRDIPLEDLIDPIDEYLYIEDIEVYIDAHSRDLKIIKEDEYKDRDVIRHNFNCVMQRIHKKDWKKISAEDFDACIKAIAESDVRNTLFDKIEGIEWDGQDRFPAFAGLLVGKDASEEDEWFAENAMRLWYEQLVIQNLSKTPLQGKGMIVLSGDQGIGKSHLVSKMSLNTFNEGHFDMNNKDMLISLTNSPICEIGEMAGFDRAEIDFLKGWLVRRADDIRKPYARDSTPKNRRTGFIGTINNSMFLKDPTNTGNRRFWVIECKFTREDWDEFNKFDFVQLLVQAKEEASEKLNRLIDWPKDFEEVQRRRSKRHEIADIDGDTFSNWLETQSGELTSRIVGQQFAELNIRSSQRQGMLMKNAGWSKKRARRDNGVMWIWTKTDSISMEDENGNL
jgi:hypothetical protein